MLKITTEAIFLSQKPLGEGKRIVRIFSEQEGVLSGVYRPRKGMILEPGTLVQAHWQARLSEQLGNMRLEPHEHPLLQPVFLKPLPMLALLSLCQLLLNSLPERMAERAFYDQTKDCLVALSSDRWLAAYVHWELNLLDALGVGLDISACAGGGSGALCYLSPKTGRAVSTEVGAPYKDKLYQLPGCLKEPKKLYEIRDYLFALQIIGDFLLKTNIPSMTQAEEFRKKLAEKLRTIA